MIYPGIYGVAQTFYFKLIGAGAEDFTTGLTDGGTDCEVIKDGGAEATATNDFAEEGNGWYSLALTATEMEADIVCVDIIDKTATKAFKDQAILIDTRLGPAILSYEGVEHYTINTTNFTPTATDFEADRGLGRAEEATTDHFKNRQILFITGPAAGERAVISGYTLSNGRGDFNVPSMVTVPASGNQFVIL